MSNASLKEQLQAVASQLSDSVEKARKPQAQVKSKQKSHPANKPAKVNKPKPKWLDYVQYGVELLRMYFPQCFKTAGEIKPLKKGIKQDLILHLSTLSNLATEDKACMVKSLAYYVNLAAYHKSVVADATRIDLNGNEAGTVSVEEAKYSIERQQAKLLAKQQAKSQAPVSNKQALETV